jgi:hypothetical protein
MLRAGETCDGARIMPGEDPPDVAAGTGVRALRGTGTRPRKRRGARPPGRDRASLDTYSDRAWAVSSILLGAFHGGATGAAVDPFFGPTIGAIFGAFVGVMCIPVVLLTCDDRPARVVLPYLAVVPLVVSAALGFGGHGADGSRAPIVIASYVGMCVAAWWCLPARMRRPGEQVCARCGYDLAGIGAPRCPECGTRRGQGGSQFQEWLGHPDSDTFARMMMLPTAAAVCLGAVALGIAAR